MWRSLARVCLKGVAVLSPVVLAACYGPAHMSLTRTVRAVDQTTQAGVAGVQVGCVAPSGALYDVATTDGRGEAQVRSGCTSLGTRAAGGYAPAAVQGVGSDEDIVIGLAAR